MGISLKFLTSIIISFIVLTVAGTCLGVTLGTAISSINKVAEDWAKGISNSLAYSVKIYFEHWEADVSSLTLLCRTKNVTLDSEYFEKANNNESASSSAIMIKKNWTEDITTPFLLRMASKHNDASNVLGVNFFNYFWTFLDQSQVDPALSMIEWIEDLQQNVSSLSIGGFRYNRSTLQVVPYSASSNYGPEFFLSNHSLLYDIPAELLGALAYRRSLDPPERFTSVLWYPILHTYVVKPDRIKRWELYLIAAVRDAQGNDIGYTSFGLDAESEFSRLLSVSKKSPSSESFIVQPDSSVVGTTYSEPFYTSEVTTASATIPQYCSSTIFLLPQLAPPRLGCLKTVNTYPYAPLNAVGADFATTPTSTFGFFKVDSKTYAIASKRITTEIASLSLNIVSILPEEDLKFDQVHRSVVLAVVLALVVAIVAIGISLLLLHLLVRRLEDVQRKMIALSKLEHLDAAENVNDGEDENDNDNIQNNSSDVVKVFFEKKLYSSGENNKNNDTSSLSDTIKVESLTMVVKKQKEKDRSWISEVANLEDAYQETVRSMTNFTRYVSKAVVSELIMQRRKNSSSSNHNSRELLPEEPLPHQNSNNNQNEQYNASSLVIDADTTHDFAAQYDVTVLVADIEGFSSQIWKTNPENHDGVLYLLHIYFKRMCRLIMGHGGVVDKFLGDSIMSYWGAPVRIEHHALLACLTALSILRESKRDPLKKIFQSTVHREVEVRCGISSGNAIVGTFGHSESVNYSIVGAPVSVARHLQQFNAYWPSSILMDGNCMRKVDSVIIHRLLCQAQFENDGPLSYVYEVMGLNLESTVARGEISADLRTIAFTDVLSLPTINSNNQGVEEILKSTSPEHDSTLSSLLTWHAKNRTALPPSFAVFAEQFSEAARLFIDCKFDQAAYMFKNGVQIPLLQNQQQGQNSASLFGLSSDANSGPLSSTPSTNNTSNFSSGDIHSSNSNNNSANLLDTDRLNYKIRMAKCKALDKKETEKAMQMMLDICRLYVEEQRPLAKTCVDPETQTYFFRAHRLQASAAEQVDVRKQQQQRRSVTTAANGAKSTTKNNNTITTAKNGSTTTTTTNEKKNTSDASSNKKSKKSRRQNNSGNRSASASSSASSVVGSRSKQ